MQLLLLEDNPTDAKLCIRELKKAGLDFEHEVVDTKEAFLEKLKAEVKPDIILSDYSLPSFTGTEAYELLKELALDIPFILITGSLKDEVAAEMLRLGLDDYILKDRLKRLPLAVERTLEKFRLREERREAYENLIASEKKYANLTKVSPVGVFRVDAKGNCNFVNKRYCQITGLTSQSAGGQGYMNAVHPEDVPIVLNAWKQLLEKPKGVSTSEFRFKKGDDNVWVIGQTRVELDEDGTVLGAVGTITDITEKKKADEELFKLTSAMRKVNDAIIITDKNDRIIWVNEAFGKMYSYSEIEVIGEKPGELLRGEQTDVSVGANLDKGIATEKPFNLEILHYGKSGEPFWVNLSVSPIFSADGTIDRYLRIATDISQKVKDGAEIDRLSNVVKQIDNSAIITDSKGRVTWVNDGFTKLSGFRLEEVIGQKPGAILQGPLTTNDSREAIRAGLNSKEPFTVEIVNYHCNGTPYDVSLSITPVFNVHGEVERFVGISTDITSLVATQRELLESEDRLQGVLEQSPDAILLTDSKGSITFFNKQAENYFGYSEREVLGEKVEKLIPKRYHKSHKPNREKYEQDPHSRSMGSGMDLFGMRKDGSEFPVDIMLTPIERSDERLMMAVVRDVTEQKKIEQVRKEFTAKLEQEVKLRTLELEQSNDLLAEINKDVADSINYAKGLQQAVMPSAENLNNHVKDSFILFEPRDVVSGDFFWFHEVTNGLVVVCSDCTGHGVPGAFMSMLGIELLNKHVVSDGMKFPSNILENLDEGIQNTLSKTGNTKMKDGMDISICTIDFRRKRVHYAGAGRPLVVVQNGNLNQVRGARFGLGMALGIESKNFETHTFDYNEGDMLYMFSDGYQDQFGGDSGRKFMVKRLKHLLLKNSEKPCSEQRETLKLELDDWMKNERQVDDILVMGVRL